nr:MAG TPA: hypothetical protein [Caudoviricetes sp.]
MGIEILDKVVYPFQDLIAMYFSDQFCYSFPIVHLITFSLIGYYHNLPNFLATAARFPRLWKYCDASISRWHFMVSF